MDRIDCLRAFVRAMEGGSFSHAARELGIGQPAVSKRIALLEREFGSQLFMRTTRRLRPTPEAHRVYELARQVLNTFETARASVREASPRPSGTLRLGIPTSFGRRYIVPIIGEYVRANPDVRVDLRLSERLVNLVEDGVELALRIGRLGPGSLVARRIGTVRRYLVASPDYLRGRGLPRMPDDLAGHQCVIYSHFAAAGRWTFDSELGRHEVEVTGSVAVDDADTMERAVLEGLGIAVLPAWCAVGAVREGRLVHLLPDFAIPSLPLHAVYPETQWMSLRARSFLDLVVARSNRFGERLAAAPARGDG